MQEQEVRIIQDESKNEYLVIEDKYDMEYSYKIEQKLLLHEQKKYSIDYHGRKTEEVEFIAYKLRTTFEGMKRTFNIRFYPKDRTYTLDEEIRGIYESRYK